MASGYSGTPLARKLGVKAGQLTWHSKMPATVLARILGEGLQPQILAAPRVGLEMAHIFVTERRELTGKLVRLRKLLAADGMIWISWLKKASKVETDITERVVRAGALPLGLVDVKVCAVDEVWSGLKLVIRKSER
jgi:hypothetical protein